MLPRIALAILLVVSGCLGPSEETPHRVNTEPNPPLEAHVGANMTRCPGAIVAFVVPPQTIEGQIPPGYTLHEQAPGTTVVFLFTLSCTKIAVNGTDAGSGSVTMAYVIVKKSASMRVPDGGFPGILLDVSTDNHALQSFLRKGGIAVGNLSVQTSWAPLPLWHEQNQVRVHHGDRDEYRVVGTADKDNAS